MEQRRSGRQKCSKGGEKLIRISQLKLPITHTKAQLEKKIAKTLKNPGEGNSYGFSFVNIMLLLLTFLASFCSSLIVTSTVYTKILSFLCLQSRDCFFIS